MTLSTQIHPPKAGPAANLPRSQAGPTPHTPLRPMWCCRADGQHWPCGDARLRLKAEFGDNPIGLAIFLVGMYYEATKDLYHLNPHDGPSPTDLFQRFVAWGPYRKPAVDLPTTAGGS
ncbi:hypothetical protein [Micromonospora hortensis]|uniref:hypothetical protein n=1 Tax=Micromonospora hortensis TaxID=2911209 RepID=UPI001EE85446|nr:hypothetical protein [Micromonospora hortensis]MCG5453233.1 hypothetical protein [Micromonospora hortensis]